MRFIDELHIEQSRKGASKMNVNIQDGKMHVVSYCEIDSMTLKSDEEENRVNVLFNGGELPLNVPRGFLVDQKAVPMFHVGDIVFVEFILGIKSVNKTFGERSYSALDVKVKRVVNFRKLTAEESKAL